MRVKRGHHRVARRKKVLKLAKGYYLTKHNAYRVAKLQVERSLLFAYRDRRTRKRTMRALWIVRINAAARLHDMSYSALIAGLKASGSALDRKLLADMAVRDPEGFGEVVRVAKVGLASKSSDEPKAKAPAKAPAKPRARSSAKAKAEAAAEAPAETVADPQAEPQA
jgi:large subunit ribosomal protein L20